MAEALDSDRAVAKSDSDEFGFLGIAESLAPRIAEACRGDGLVIGIEGRWGTGKSSLMNLIRLQLDSIGDEKVNSITIAPWLDGDSSSLVLSMLTPIANVLEDESSISETDALKEKTKQLGLMVITG